MKNPLSKLPNEKARKELKQFATLGLAFGIMPLFIFGWLAIVGLALSARALVLSKHEGNKKNPSLKRYQAMAIVGLALSVLDLVLFYSSN